jgi:hypothetical protein
MNIFNSIALESLGAQHQKDISNDKILIGHRTGHQSTLLQEPLHGPLLSEAGVRSIRDPPFDALPRQRAGDLHFGWIEVAAAMAKTVDLKWVILLFPRFLSIPFL